MQDTIDYRFCLPLSRGRPSQILGELSCLHRILVALVLVDVALVEKTNGKREIEFERALKFQLFRDRKCRNSLSKTVLCVHCIHSIVQLYPTD
jgi:hypothetical protein